MHPCRQASWYSEIGLFQEKGRSSFHISTRNPYLCPPFHKQQGWCPVEGAETTFCKRKNVKPCLERKEHTSPTHAAGNLYTGSAGACRMPMAVRYWPAAGQRAVISSLFQTSTDQKNNTVSGAAPVQLTILYSPCFLQGLFYVATHDHIPVWPP